MMGAQREQESDFASEDVGKTKKSILITKW